MCVAIHLCRKTMYTSVGLYYINYTKIYTNYVHKLRENVSTIVRTYVSPIIGIVILILLIVIWF